MFLCFIYCNNRFKLTASCWGQNISINQSCVCRVASPRGEGVSFLKYRNMQYPTKTENCAGNFQETWLRFWSLLDLQKENIIQPVPGNNIKNLVAMDKVLMPSALCHKILRIGIYNHQKYPFHCILRLKVVVMVFGLTLKYNFDKAILTKYQ